MRKLTAAAAALLLLAWAGTAQAQGITGTAHDFSASAWNSSGEMCNVCHTPHNADTSVTDSPLWDHEVTTATYTLYSGTDATMAQPSGISKLCLSCHDGTVALENFGITTTGTNMIATAGNVGTDLSDDHPVGFTYDAALATSDGGLYDPTSQTSGLGGTISADMLFSGVMECASCHDVHDAYNQTSLLVMSNTGSALCLTCHNK